MIIKISLINNIIPNIVNNDHKVAFEVYWNQLPKFSKFHNHDELLYIVLINKINNDPNQIDYYIKYLLSDDFDNSDVFVSIFEDVLAYTTPLTEKVKKALFNYIIDNGIDISLSEHFSSEDKWMFDQKAVAYFKNQDTDTQDAYFSAAIRIGDPDIVQRFVTARYKIKPHHIDVAEYESTEIVYDMLTNP